jgi:hypothetical protein
METKNKKDLGKKLFAFSKFNIDKALIISEINK